MFGVIFKTTFQFLRTLYNFWTILANFREKIDYPMEFGKIILKKSKIGSRDNAFNRFNMTLVHGENRRTRA